MFAAIAALLLAVITPGFAQMAPSADLLASGEQFVDLLVKSDFTKAVSLFDPTMQSALPAQKLKQIWQTIQQQAGPFQARLRTRKESSGGYYLVFVTCHFAQLDLDAKVVFDSQQRIAGLYFVPSPPAPPAARYAKPSSVIEKDFTVGSGEWRLPGTLTLPAAATGLLPAVVLVHGSGPNDRDETILANKPFQDLAWGLATKGIAVLRYEKRTRQYAAKLVVTGGRAFTVKEESIADALSAATQLRHLAGIDPQRIFIIGHSLGGTVAPRIAQADPKLAGLVILAGATRPLEDLMLEQTRYLLLLGGASAAEAQAKLEALAGEVAKVKKLTAADADSAELILHAPPPYWLDLREHDPLIIAQSLHLPIFILQGGRDYQVTQVDFAGWKQALGAQPGVTCKLYPDLNHLFMTGEGKSRPSEYEHPGHVAENVIDDVAAWILKIEPTR